MNKENRFNLIDEPWIPVVDAGRVSLKQLFSNSSYKALGGNPMQKIALTKLLLAITQSAYTPSDDKDWELLKSEGMAEKCLSYLDKWRDRFWLYGEKPFLQMPEILLAAEQNFGAVLPEVASGNTTVLTETHVERVLTDEDKALLIVTLMGFSLGGKKTDNSIVLSQGYRGKVNEKGKPSTGKPGASLGIRGFMHNFLLGESLQKTLWFNLFTSEQLSKISIYPEGVGIAPWQQMPEGENCDTAQKLQKTLIGRLVPLSRFCLLGSEGIHYTEGITHPGYKDGVVDPSIAANFSHSKVIWVDPEKRPWRYLTALLSFISHSSGNNFDCLHVRLGLAKIAYLRQKQEVQSFGIWSGGIKVSYHPAGEQYCKGGDDFVESSVTLSSHCLGEPWYEQLKSEMDVLEKLSRIVYSSTRGYFESQNMKKDGEERAKMASNLFWQLCERKFQQLVDSCAKDNNAKTIRKTFIQCVNKAYNMFCPKDTSRQLDAWAKHLPKLNKYLS